MIPLEKELEVHTRLLAGEEQRAIATSMKVGPSTVNRIARAVNLAANVGHKKRARVRLLLIGGISPEAVASRMNLLPDAVWAIKRAEFLMASVVDSPHPCPTCGATMLPAEKGEEHEPSPTPSHVSVENVAKLYDIADDVVGLSKALTVENLLFYEIADRAERLLATIAGEDENAEEEENEDFA